MADSAVNFVVDRLGEFVVKEATELQEVGNDVMLLKDKLQWLQTFVQMADHERRQAGGGAYREVWVQQTREVALEVEDVLDEFMLGVNIEDSLPLWKKWLEFLSTCTTQISVRHDLKGRIAMIRARLDQISQHSKDYIADHSSPAAKKLPSPSLTTTDGWDEEVRMIGFTEECSSLKKMLLEGDTRRSIVSIIGESGIGKSTLARMVLDSHVVKQHFGAHAWLNLPPCSTEADALYLIYQLLCPSDDAPKTEETIRDALMMYLVGKCYVIVLDGIEKLFNWSAVLGALPDNDLGSRVVIIDALGANKAAFAGYSTSVLRVEVYHLKENESRHLFCRHALGSGNKHLSKSFGSKDLLESNEYNKEIMDDMFKITTGFPLAILLLGRLLRRKEFPDQWREVLNHLKSMEQWSSRLEHILALCFDDLPHPLKLRFLYFSMMPRNMNYAAAVLVRRWAAEGFLKPVKGESMEDVGHKYLKELISRGMVSISWKGPLTYEGSTIKSVFIHRRLHAMAQLETQKGSFLDICDSTDVPSSTVVRHLFIQNFRDVVDIHMDAPFPKLRSVRCHFSEYWEPVKCSFLEYPRPNLAAIGGGATAINGDRPYHGDSLRHLLKSKLLRVIELRGLQLRKLPRAIGDLIHLRKLGCKKFHQHSG
ncbi:unnamed protein product [Urochloa humidicola]